MLSYLASAGLLFLLLLPSAMTTINYGSRNLRSVFLKRWDDDVEVARRTLDIPGSSWPMWHPARRHLRNWSTVTRRLPYHPVVRFRSSKPDFSEYPVIGYALRYEGTLKKDLNMAEVWALLSNIMMERGSQGGLKGIRFGIRKR